MTYVPASRCHHHDTVPVDVSDHVTVARLCTHCLEQLPAAWGCLDCDWREAYATFAGPVPAQVLARPCPAHQEPA